MTDLHYLTPVEVTDSNCQPPDDTQYVLNTLTLTPIILLSLATQHQAHPKDILTIQDITPRYLQQMISNPRKRVRLYPMLLTLGGLPGSGKSKVLEAFYTDRDSAVDSKDISMSAFSHREIIATGFSSKIVLAEVSKNTSFYYGMQSGFQYNLALDRHEAKFCSTKDISRDCDFNDEFLERHVDSVYGSLREQLINQSELSTKSQNQHTSDIKKALPRGVAIINIWELAVSRTILRFLECFRGHLYNNHMWLFLDLDRDRKRLHLPPQVGLPSSENIVPLTMIWKSRLHYLLRSSCLSDKLIQPPTSPEFILKKVCHIVAVYDEILNENDVKILQKECKNAAEQAGVSHLINFKIDTVKKANLKSKRVWRKKLIRILQKYEDHLPEIPLSWVFLCSLFQHNESFFMTHSDLQQKAEQCGIKEDSYKKFCQFCTSFGGIFDIQLIDKESEYVIVRPAEFLEKLHEIFTLSGTNDQVSEYGIISSEMAKSHQMFGEDATAFLKILVSVGLAVEVCKDRLAVSNLAFKCPSASTNRIYYISAIRTCAPVIECTPGAVQLVSGMKSPSINMQIAFTTELLKLLPDALLVPTKAVNVTTIEARPSNGSIKVQIVVQGDVIELLTTPNGDKKDMVNVCCSIVKAAQNIADKRSERGGDVKYHFAVICASDRNQSVYYNIHHLQHILPKESFCTQCQQNGIFKIDVHQAWNVALRNNQIQRQYMLSGDLTQDDLMMLVKNISRYPDWVIEALQDKLQCELDTTMSKGLNWWCVSKLIMEWVVKRETNKEEESCKRALARKLLETHSTIKTDVRFEVMEVYPNFLKMARNLDIQVLTEDQIRDIQ